MTRARRLALIVGGSLTGLLVVLLAVGIVIVQTDWFRNLVRRKIVSAVETGTGGRAEIGSFAFDWRHLRADVRDFVVHGLEPAGAAPLFRARLVEVDLKLTSPFKGAVDIAYLLADTPQANVIVYPDGHTNVPSPKVTTTGNKSGLETIVDLAIGRFDLRNGSFTFAGRQSDLSASGGNLRAQIAYNPLHPSYRGEIDISPLHLKSAGNAPLDVDVRLPLVLEKDKITLADARLNTPLSQVVVSGSMEHLIAPRAVAHIVARVALEEANRAAGLGLVLDAAHGPRILNADITASMDENRIEFGSLRLGALGGSFTGSAVIEHMEQFRVTGNVSGFDIAQTARVFMPTALGYDGIVSGPVAAEGNLKNGSSLVAHAGLVIAPAPRGMPVSGRLNADYNGAAGTVALSRSYVALPNSRIDLSGTLGQRIDVRLVSRNLNDFRPVAAIPVVLNGGVATVNATVSGSLSAPQIAAQVAVTNFSAEGRQFTRFAADVNASRTGASVANGALTHGALLAQFSATVGLRNWKPENDEPLHLDATIRNADVRDVLALAGQADPPVTGALAAAAHVDGTIGDPRGNADFTVVNGTAEGERFDSLTAHVIMTQGSIAIPTLALVAGPARLDANAAYQHARGTLERGTLQAHVTSNQIQLAQFQSLAKSRPGLRGMLSLNADAAAAVDPSAGFRLTSLHANAAAHGLQMEGKSLGDFTAAASSAGSTVEYDVNSNFAGSTIRVNGQSLLTGDHRTTATAAIASLPIDQVLALAGRGDLPLKGMLAANAQVSGTLQDPRAGATFTITKGSAYQEPFDRLQATVNYSSQSIDVPQFRLEDGPSNIELTASFTHPPNDLENGQVRFHVRSNPLQLTRFHTAQQFKPGLAGVVELAADGAATLRANAAPLVSTLTANLSAKSLTVNKKPVGDVTATAQTQGREVTFHLTSDFARANIKGDGRLELGGDYPLTAQLNFTNLTYSGLSNWIGGAQPGLEASLEGRASVSGPLSRTEALQGTVELSKLEAHSVVAAKSAQPRVKMELHNAGPVVVSLDRSVVTIQSARITGPSTNLTLSGTASLGDPQKLNLRAEGNVQLDVLEAIDPDIFSAGNVVLNAAITGTTAKPAINGRLQLQNASFNMLDAPNGLSNGNGTITFNGTEAVIQNLTGETGGGKIALTGFANYGGPEMQFRIQATAEKVRVEYPATVSTEASAQLTFAGTTARSLLSGTVTILDVALHSHSDVGSMLNSAATPPSTTTATTGLLAGMRFVVRIQTAPNIHFRTTLAENLQAEARLTLVGTLDQPGMVGRASVTQGEVVFFGNKYTVNQGTISFFDPRKINPELNVDLETKVQGVDVTLRISGPMDRMKLSYSSDPPMQFSDLATLLASGKLTTTDPVLAARQPTATQQSFEQTGASALLGQAVGNPVSGRLQRLFGVSKLKIDPQITGASSTPQATLTLQQQITRELTFTYIQDITQSNPQIIRIEWAINPRWSAIAARDLNGSLDLDFFYKRRFR
ncbi:MAG: translocation/assembly module TamB domain-containing protein [Acidobacteriia bacterium]|nr:translocation/assembly module TamB domain-containing protein [Terriglobia bacterium]